MSGHGLEEYRDDPPEADGLSWGNVPRTDNVRVSLFGHRGGLVHRPATGGGTLCNRDAWTVPAATGEQAEAVTCETCARWIDPDTCEGEGRITVADLLAVCQGLVDQGYGHRPVLMATEGWYTETDGLGRPGGGETWMGLTLFPGEEFDTRSI